MLIVLLGLGLAVSLAFNFGVLGGKPEGAPAVSTPSAAPQVRATSQEAGDKARSIEGELDKKKKELEELRKAHNDVKDELKTAKKKLFDATQGGKDGDDLAKARAEVERQASIQLENTRHELANALTEVQKLKGELEGKGKKKQPRVEEEKKVEAKPVEKPQEVIQKVIRELSDAEKERITRLEAQSQNDRKKAADADKELRHLRAKLERNNKESKHVFSEAKLAQDKFRAVEMRLNRTLLENDLLRRAISDLEKKTGQHAEHTSPTADEIAESDRKMKEKHQAEDKASAEALEKLTSAPATEGEAPAEAAAPAATPEAPAAAPAPTA